MKKNTIKNIVILPLFIATLLTSFYVMQPQNASAFTRTYIDDGDDTPYASDRFNDVAEDLVETDNTWSVTSPGDATTNKIELELQQLVDCQLGSGQSNTCIDTTLRSTQNVKLDSSGADPNNPNSIDFEADLFMLQKDDTAGQTNVNNLNEGTQTVDATTIGEGQIDASHNGDLNEVNFDMWQYNKRGAIDSEDRIASNEINVIGAIQDEDGGGNDDASSENRATQTFNAEASDSAFIEVADDGDTDFTVAQFNAGCDDTDTSPPATIDVFCDNIAEQNINLLAQGNNLGQGGAKISFNTPNPVEFQQINTCTFGRQLDCDNDGSLDVNVEARGLSGIANVEIENSNDRPALFQENTCSNLNRINTATPATSQNDCDNVSLNILDVTKGGTSSIGTSDETHGLNLDMQVVQRNDCDSATAPIDCTNGGRISGVDDLNGDNLQLLYPDPMTTLVTASATGAGSLIEDANVNSYLTMVNNCDNARPVSTSTLGANECTNDALNEAHFAALSGADVDVDDLRQTSTTTNTCNSLDNDACQNLAQNTFVANAATDATININPAVIQTNTLTNSCTDAECTNDALNSMLLNANDGAVISASSSDLTQTNTLRNTCSSEADCDNTASNSFSIFAEGDGSDVIISDLTQRTTLTNTCSGSGTTCTLAGFNDYEVQNTSGDTLTINPTQTITLTCSVSGGADCDKDQFNTFTYYKTSGNSLSFTSTQTSTTGNVDRVYTNTDGSAPQQGTCTLTQSGPPSC